MAGTEFVDDIHRILAKKTFDEPERSDYSILSVSVMTLGLILMIELARHKIDHYAQYRPFLKAVLDDVYAELSTLGLVELCIWILLTYWETINIPKEKVFAKVHFTLFYTAVFNAFQTVVLAVASMSVSRKLWVQTETLELNHYVEIREEFQHVQAQLDALHHKQKQRADRSPTNNDGSASNNVDDEEFHVDSEDAIHFNRQGLHVVWEGLADRIRHPRLKARYNALLLQVRFHELRVHFLEAYELPAKFKVSDYLIRSETQVLISLVQVSTYAWLLLTAAVNLMYFFMGIVTWTTESPKKVGTSLTWIFFWALVVFVLVTWLVYNKMKWIFHTIMHDASLWKISSENEENVGLTVRDDLATKQRDLFWGGDPNLVVAAVQFMQFGYAIALAIVLIFWDTIKKGDIDIIWFLVGIFGCYAVFVCVAAQLIPRYTLCTSLGQLVNRNRLQEAAALYHLEEERQKRLEMKEIEFNMSTQLKSYRRIPGAKPPVNKIALHGNQANHLADLVKSDTDSLRSTLPDLDADSVRRDAEARKLRRQRRKAYSEGVATMASMKSDNSSLPRTMDDSDMNPGLSLNASQRRLKAISDGVSSMAGADHQSEVDVINLRDLKPIEVRLTDTPDSNDGDGYDSDCHSDVDDVPDAPLFSSKMMEHDDKPTVEERLREYYISKQYWSVSHVFGTLFAFFCVGQRVERFLHTDGVVGDDFVSYDFDNPITFWALTCWLLMFWVNDTALIYVLGKNGGYKEASLKERKLMIAAFLDIMLTFTCLTIFFVAEGKRCCIPDGTEPIPTDDVFAPAPCACEPFGFRLHGGLGTMEPWVALVGIRIFRGWLAKRLVSFVDSIILQPNGVYSDRKRSRTTNHGLIDPFDVFGDDDHHGHHGGSHRPAIELWQTAIGAHPDIVSKYGEFSGELLQAMLGLQMTEANSSSNSISSGTLSTRTRTISEKVFSNPSARKTVAVPPVIPEVRSAPEADKVFSVGREFEHLSSGAQEIIVAGKLGVGVKPLSVAELGSTAVIPEENSAASSAGGISATRQIKFEMDRDSARNSALENSIFVAPNARLVRSMRRCGRKLLPVLDKWTAVDVVMTRYEIVYLEVTDESHLESTPIRQALAATHGGKGLRLCDVVGSRQVAGHLLLSDIRSVHVEREVGGSTVRDQDDLHCGDDTHVEYWLHAKLSLEHAWSTTSTEDRLKIEIDGGRTLFLRFYTDLIDIIHNDEMGASPRADDAILKNNAFQWAQSLVRLCGSGRLHQRLPHFGNSTDEELRDYLVVHHHRGDGVKKPLSLLRVASHGRATSTGSDKGSDKNNSQDTAMDAV